MATQAIDRSLLSIMSEEGDKRIQWDSKVPSDVTEAEKLFNEWKAKGYAAYKVKRDGSQEELIHKFDPLAERVIMRPPMVGG